jgi:hypothetical protein
MAEISVLHQREPRKMLTRLSGENAKVSEQKIEHCPYSHGLPIHSSGYFLVFNHF